MKRRIRKRPSQKPGTRIQKLRTELQNSASADFDTKTSLEMARIINAEDQRVPQAIETALPQIARAIDAVAKAFQRGGRLIYVGTGTSGRLGALDAAECPPTFSAGKMVDYVIAGGDRALGHAVEADEDSAELGRDDLKKKRPTRKDVVIGLAASGRTPYTVAALEFAHKKGCTTVAVTANAGSPLEKVATIPIVVVVGPEVIAGSTRMKAATMQKLVCNTITTGAFARIGHVYGNLMVDVQLNNSKLLERGIAILQTITGCDRQSASDALEVAHRSVPEALVMLEAGISPRQAQRKLKSAAGNVRRAIEAAHGKA
jgi:N-acetylmuramic acid 6-phosphate etherase